MLTNIKCKLSERLKISVSGKFENSSYFEFFKKNLVGLSDVKKIYLISGIFVLNLPGRWYFDSEIHISDISFVRSDHFRKNSSKK